MSLAIIYTRAQVGIQSPLVTVEVHISNGLPGFAIVGLPEAAVKESKDRVRSALLNSQLEFPAKRITVNLAPADLPKEGGRYDLPIALGILAASEQIPIESVSHYEFIGELALSGALRKVRGSLPSVIACGEDKRKSILPAENADEAGLCQTTEVYVAENLLQVCAHLHKKTELPKPAAPQMAAVIYEKDLADVKGQLQAKRALEIAAAGGHNILLFGPPGTGKSMLASRLPSILPPLSEEEALEVAVLRSIASEQIDGQWRQRTFRNPHHTSSAVSLVGGGANPKPGEISLAHRGILFLDELPEFPRQVLEVLREPLENGEISISRAAAQVRYPSKCQFVAAMNPCPCGFLNDGTDRCRCTPPQISRYRDKISGPLLDRIDLHIQVANIPLNELQNLPSGETSEHVRMRVNVTFQKQIQRQQKSNAQLSGNALDALCELGSQERQLLASAMERLQLSARAYDRIRRVARTIADLENSDKVKIQHISEAISYRQFDRSL